MTILEYLLMSMYIFALLLGTVVTTLTIIFAIKRKSELNNNLKIFSIAFLFYIVFEFFIYYMMENESYSELLFLFIHFSNLCYFLFLLCWIRLLQLLSGKQSIISQKILIRITVFYGISAEGCAVLTARYNPSTHFYQVEEGLAQQLLSICNLFYGLLILYLATRYFLYGMKSMEKSNQRNAVILFSFVLFFYMIWIMSWDYHMVTGTTIDSDENYSMDPLTFLYVIQSLGVIWFFLKKDPLEVTKVEEHNNKKINQVSEQLNLEIISKDFGLTNREFDVLTLVSQGLSNPEIGEKLFIAENTVKRHLNHIFSKIQVKNRYELLSIITRNSRV